MRKPHSKLNRGQVLIAVALALFGMFGIVGLVFDAGWSFYVEKATQTAADSAALAAVIEAYELSGSSAPVCGDTYQDEDGNDVTISCGTTPVQCPSTTPGSVPTTTYESGCLYAKRNGFWPGNPAERQNVTFAADSAGAGGTITPPTAPGVNVYYWATARVVQQNAQLFSAILGNSRATVSSRATAAIVDSVITGSLFLLNRELDGGFGSMGDGVNLEVNSNANNQGFSLRSGGRVLLSSQAHGDDGLGYAAELSNGNAVVRAPSVGIRGAGGYDLTGGAEFQDLAGNVQDPTNMPAQSKLFLDPTQGLENPPLVTGTQNAYGLPSGVVGSNFQLADPTAEGGNSASNPYLIPPGVYYSYQPAKPNAPAFLDGQNIQIGGPNFHYAFCSSWPCGGFGEYTFLGGLSIDQANVTFGPGRYVYAGAKATGNQINSTLSIETNATVIDGFTGNQVIPEGNPGQIHILAGPNYEGADGRTISNFLANQTQGSLFDLGNAFNNPTASLSYAPANLHSGNTDGTEITLHGLQPVAGNDGLPSNLEPYRRFLMWQDRDNSVFDYGPEGSYNCADISTACDAENLQHIGGTARTELEVQASPNISLYGVIYQPRGSFFSMIGGGGYSGPLQIVTGAFFLEGNAEVDLGILDHPLVKRIVALVE